LIELSVAMGMMTVAMAGISSVTVNLLRLQRHQRVLTQAIALADEVTEGLLLLDPSDPDLVEGTHTRAFDRLGRELLTGTGFYQTTWTVTNYEEVAGLRGVALTVHWSEGSRAREIGWSTWRN